MEEHSLGGGRIPEISKKKKKKKMDTAKAAADVLCHKRVEDIYVLTHTSEIKLTYLYYFLCFFFFVFFYIYIFIYLYIFI